MTDTTCSIDDQNQSVTEIPAADIITITNESGDIALRIVGDFMNTYTLPSYGNNTEEATIRNDGGNVLGNTDHDFALAAKAMKALGITCETAEGNPAVPVISATGLREMIGPRSYTLNRLGG